MHKTAACRRPKIWFFTMQVILDANGLAPAGDCYDVTTGLKMFVGMAALIPSTASTPIIISPLSTLAGIAAIIGVSEAVQSASYLVCMINLVQACLANIAMLMQHMLAHICEDKRFSGGKRLPTSLTVLCECAGCEDGAGPAFHRQARAVQRPCGVHRRPHRPRTQGATIFWCVSNGTCHKNTGTIRPGPNSANLAIAAMFSTNVEHASRGVHCQDCMTSRGKCPLDPDQQYIHAHPQVFTTEIALVNMANLAASLLYNPDGTNIDYNVLGIQAYVVRTAVGINITDFTIQKCLPHVLSEELLLGLEPPTMPSCRHAAHSNPRHHSAVAAGRSHRSPRPIETMAAPHAGSGRVAAARRARGPPSPVRCRAHQPHGHGHHPVGAGHHQEHLLRPGAVHAGLHQHRDQRAADRRRRRHRQHQHPRHRRHVRHGGAFVRTQ